MTLAPGAIGAEPFLPPATRGVDLLRRAAADHAGLAGGARRRA
jgi:hypothetical protein